MESARIRTIINLYAELKSKGDRFKDVEPCFVEGNDYLAKLWTTANASGGSGNENPFPIEIPDIQGTDKGLQEPEGTGTIKDGVNGVGSKGKDDGKGEGKGESVEGEGGEGGEGEGKDGKGKGKGKGNDEGGEGGDDEKKKFKVGDKIRVKGTGAIGTITKVNDDGTYEVGKSSDIENKKENYSTNISKDTSIADINEDDGEGTAHHGKAEGTFGGDEIEPYNEDEDGGSEEGGGQQPIPPIEQPEFTQEEEKNISEYKMKFPLISEMIYGIKVCNNSTEEETRKIERKLFVGIGVTVCRSLMAEGNRYGESVLSAKKEAYRGMFDMILLLCVRKNEYDCDGNLLNANNPENEQELKKLIIADKFVAKIIPILAVFNKELFNERQVDNAIDFCMARLGEKDSVLVSSRYSEETVESTWGLMLFRGDDKKNYNIIYYKYTSSVSKNTITQRNENKKNLEKVTAITVSGGNLDYSLDLETMGDEFYDFVWALIYNYLNNNSQDIEQQGFKYKNKKHLIMDSATNILTETINYVERLV